MSFLVYGLQTDDAYSTWGLTVALYVASRIPGCLVLMFLLRNPKFFEALAVMRLTWWLKIKPDELSTSRYRAWSMESRTCPCIVYLFLIGLRDLDMCTTWHLDGLNSMSHAFSHSCNIFRSFWMISVSSWPWTAKYTAVSSANRRTLDCILSGRSLI